MVAMSDERREMLADVDREDIPTPSAPVLVELDERTLFVPNHYVEEGWLTVHTWDGTRNRYPAHRVQKIHGVDRSHVKFSDGLSVRTLDDPELVRLALEMSGVLESDDTLGQRPVIA
jgi:hypothetical protein